MDITTLVDLIKNDLGRNGSYDRYPVRFFSMKYETGVSDALIQIKMRINNVDIFDINSLLPHEDGWITEECLRKAIYELPPLKSHIVVGFSEYARFLGEAEFISLLIGLLQTENSDINPKRRIYIPCFALYSQIKKVIKSYHRRFDTYNPLLNETDIEDLPRIFFLNPKLNADILSNEVFNSQEWFCMWRNSEIDTETPIVCSSKTLSHFYAQASPDNVYNIHCIEDYKDMLKHMYRIDHMYDYKKNSQEFYRRLIGIVKERDKKEIGDIILSEINTQSIDASNIYILWKANDDLFKRWLIQNYILMKLPDSSYLYKLMSTVEELSDKEFIEKLYINIFDYRDILLCQERNQILLSIKKTEKDIFFSNRMISYYNNSLLDLIKNNTDICLDTLDFNKENKILSEKKDILSRVIGEEIVPYLTCYSSYERQLVIWLYRMKFIKDDQVKKVYPGLWYYSNGIDSNVELDDFSEGFEKYFRTYNNLRLAQEDSVTYDTALSEWNKDENSFYDWYINSQIEYPEMYLKKKKFNSTVYVLDGVGAEFIGYILKILEEKGYSTESIGYCKCHLPSITTVAKEFYPPEYKWFDDYDKKVNHNGPYYHVSHIEKGLTELAALIDRIASDDEDGIFAITADHGASVGHKIQKKNKKYNFDKSEHDGRCYYNKSKKYIEPTKDYIIYDDEFGKQWVIALNQQSLYHNSKYAVHGGATLEEVLVPVIIARKGKQVIKSYRVKPINLNVSGLDKKIKMKVSPLPQDIEVTLRAKDGTNIKMTLNSDADIWTGELKRGIEQDIEVCIGKQIFKFRTIPPTKMGDDLFDD